MKALCDTQPLRAIGHAAFDVVAETLWPTRCAVCDSTGALLCDVCATSLPYIDVWRSCPRCGAPWGRTQCTECNPVMLSASKRSEFPLEQLASALVFDEASRRIITAYKDQGERRLAKVMGPMMARYVPPSWVSDPQATAITFVPATAAARRRRGFDHAEELADSVSEKLGLACMSLLMQPRSADQRQLSRTQRQLNMRRRLSVIPGATVPKRVIVVDDVCTTGATLYAAADALRDQGCKTVFGLTFARVWD